MLLHFNKKGNLAIIVGVATLIGVALAVLTFLGIDGIGKIIPEVEKASSQQDFFDKQNVSSNEP